MNLSLLNPTSCGFIKAFLYNKSTYSRISHADLLQSYNDIYTNDNKKMEIKQEEIVRRLGPLKKLIQKLGKTFPNKKKDFLEWFSSEEWGQLTAVEKSKHLPFNCHECTSRYKQHLFLLPSSQKLKRKENQIKISLPAINPNSSKYPLQDITKKVFDDINTQFTCLTGIDFATAQAQSHSIGLTKVLSKVEKQKEQRSGAKKIISAIENQYEKTAVLRYIQNIKTQM